MAEGERELAGEGAPAGKTVTAHRGFYPVVLGNKVEVSQGGGVIFLAKDELEIQQGGGQWMIGLRKLEVERGGCGVMVAGRAEASRSVIGVLLAGRAELKEGSRVLMTLPQAVVAGLAAGVVVALTAWWNRTRAGTVPG